MNERSKKLADRLNAFNEEVISFVMNCTDSDWQKVGIEDWPVGVTARHIAANHYAVVPGVKLILKGEKFPPMTMEQITENANRHAREHAGCTKTEVLEILRDKGQKIVEFTLGLQDWELDKTGYLPALGRELSVGQFLENVVLQSAGEHFQSIKAATGK
ncbi:MAG: hypothetical protein M0Z81_11725 [Deltaproteobacteria bacterium]|jgi:hypothetical protein|nr:hypothetical protein [Deltaproteobacteria bacterium]